MWMLIFFASILILVLGSGMVGGAIQSRRRKTAARRLRELDEDNYGFVQSDFDETIGYEPQNPIKVTILDGDGNRPKRHLQLVPPPVMFEDDEDSLDECGCGHVHGKSDDSTETVWDPTLATMTAGIPDPDPTPISYVQNDPLPEPVQHVQHSTHYEAPVHQPVEQTIQHSTHYEPAPSHSSSFDGGSSHSSHDSGSGGSFDGGGHHSH